MGDPVLSLNTDQVVDTSAKLRGAQESLNRSASGLDQGIPEVPEDQYGLGDLYRRFDDAREAFDHRLGDTMMAASTRLAVLVLHAVEADGLPNDVNTPASTTS